MILNIKENINLTKNWIKMAFIENKYILLFSTLLFVIPMFLGYIFAPYLESLLDPVVNNFQNKIQEGEIKLTFESIFSNNLYVLLTIYSGAIVFGLITAMILISNGLFIGYYANGIPLETFLILTLPHGIFEIPAIIIAGAGSFTLISFLIYFIKGLIFPERNKWGEKPKTLKIISNSFNKNFNKLGQSLTLLIVGIILLAIAAFIETYITINLANFILSFFMR